MAILRTDDIEEAKKDYGNFCKFIRREQNNGSCVCIGA